MRKITFVNKIKRNKIRLLEDGRRYSEWRKKPSIKIVIIAFRVPLKPDQKLGFPHLILLQKSVSLSGQYFHHLAPVIRDKRFFLHSTECKII